MEQHGDVKGVVITTMKVGVHIPLESVDARPANRSQINGLFGVVKGNEIVFFQNMQQCGSSIISATLYWMVKFNDTIRCHKGEL